MLFYQQNITPEERKAMAKDISIFASNKEQMTSEQLFFFSEALISYYKNHLQNNPNFGDLAIVNKMIDLLKNICIRRIQSPEANNLLAKAIDGKKYPDSEFTSALKALQASETTQSSVKQPPVSTGDKGRHKGLQHEVAEKTLEKEKGAEIQPDITHTTRPGGPSSSG